MQTVAGKPLQPLLGTLRACFNLESALLSVHESCMQLPVLLCCKLFALR